MNATTPQEWVLLERRCHRTHVCSTSKLLDFEGGVNIALGLPIIRTSVDHGTAFDIAWKGMASNTSLLKAIKFAERLARVS
jgi:4-hydroxy-L-threonine phosphate dehydrogenase PdxA